MGYHGRSRDIDIDSLRVMIQLLKDVCIPWIAAAASEYPKRPCLFGHSTPHPSLGYKNVSNANPGSSTGFPRVGAGGYIQRGGHVPIQGSSGR